MRAAALPAADLIGRNVTAYTPGRKLGGDIAFIATGEDWLYLAIWLDLATLEIVGYSMADHYRASLVVEALTLAVDRGGLQPGCIGHSDRIGTHLRRTPTRYIPVETAAEYGPNRLVL